MVKLQKNLKQLQRMVRHLHKCFKATSNFEIHHWEGCIGMGWEERGLDAAKHLKKTEQIFKFTWALRARISESLSSCLLLRSRSSSWQRVYWFLYLSAMVFRSLSYKQRKNPKKSSMGGEKWLRCKIQGFQITKGTRCHGILGLSIVTYTKD